MRRTQFLLLFFLLFASVWAQELTIQGRVIDAETGETLPYASIYVGEGRGTLTNIDGEFRLTVSEQDLLTISYVGYEKRKIKASEVAKVIKLKPFERQLKEVVVKPIDEMDILKQVIKNLKSEFSKHKNDRQAYFMRVLMKNRKDSYLIESLMAWSSAVNLRDDETFSGIYGINSEGNTSSLDLRLTNIHRVAEIGALTFKSKYWEAAIKPLNNLQTIKKYYNVESHRLLGDDGEMLYRFTFRWNDKHTKTLGNRRYLTGDIYLDAKTLRLLRFDGEVGNAYQTAFFSRRPATIKFHMGYDYSRGYAAVGNLAVQGGNETLNYKLLLFAIQADNLVQSGGGLVGDNIIDALSNAGYDSALWKKYDLIKRTEEEEYITFGEKLE